MSRVWPSRRLVEILFVAGLLAAVAWVWSVRRERTTVAPVTVAALAPDSGEPIGGYLLIEGDTLHFDLRGDDYWLRSPRDRLDPTYVLELMRLGQTLKPLRVLPDTAGEGFGLRPPRGGIGLIFAGAGRWGIAVGDEVPAGGQRYARLSEPGAPVFLLDGFVARNYFLPTLDRARDRVAASLRVGPPDSIVVLAAGHEVRAFRESKDRWRTTRPPGLSLDPARVNAVVQLLRGPNIREFVTGATPAESLGLTRPRSTWIICQGARRETVRVGRATADLAGIYIRPAGRPGAAILATEQYRSLMDGLPGLADRRLLSLPADSVESIRILGPSAVTYRRDDERWRREESADPPARLDALSTELGNLLALQWESWPEPSAVPSAGAPRLRLVVASSARAETLELASDPQGGAWARNTRRRMWGHVPETVWNTWQYRLRRP